jgi:hypothetical protein
LRSTAALFEVDAWGGPQANPLTTVARRAQHRKQERVPPSSMCSPSSADGPRPVEEQRTPVAGSPSPRRSHLGHPGGAPIPGHPGGDSSNSCLNLISHNLRQRGASAHVHPHARGGNCGWGRSWCAARRRWQQLLPRTPGGGQRCGSGRRVRYSGASAVGNCGMSRRSP